MPKKAEGEWKTIRGQHVLIGGDGTIQSGSLKGKKISELSGKSSSSSKKSASNKKSSSSSTKKSTAGKKSSSSSSKKNFKFKEVYK